ncbi:hypothetical protein FQR65_LT17493 [Abscondita terminalis]|nr:hypothetical protein FQR65_LT17493 [Abscondita terminalis]
MFDDFINQRRPFNEYLQNELERVAFVNLSNETNEGLYCSGTLSGGKCKVAKCIRCFPNYADCRLKSPASFKMYALVKFVEDSVYYVCQFKHTKKTSDYLYKAKWIDGRYYLAKLIARHPSKSTLDGFQRNLELGYPIIALSRKNLEHTPRPFVKPTPDFNLTKNIEELGQFSVNRELVACSSDTSTFPHLINTRPSSSQIECSDRYSDSFSQLNSICEKIIDFNIEGNAEVTKDDTFCQNQAASEEFSFDVDLLFEHVSEHTSNANLPTISPQFGSLSVDEILVNNENGIENASPFTEFEIVDSNIVEFQSDNVDLNISNLPAAEVTDVEVDIQENIPTISFDFPEFEQSFSNNIVDENPNYDRSVVSTLAMLADRKKKAVPLRYDRSVVLEPCTNTRIKDISSLPVPTFERGKIRKYFCIYCKKLFRKFPQHLQVSHTNEEAVKMFMILPKKNAERRKIIETIRRRGDFEYNTSENCSELLVARRSQVDFPKTSNNYLPCPYCTAFFCKSTLRLHVKHCTTVVRKGERNVNVLSRTILNSIHPSASELLKKNIFAVLRNDDCVNVIRYDRLAIIYGNFLCSKYSAQHHQDMIRSKLRTIGRLLIAARTLDSTITDFASLLTPGHFDVAVAAIKKVGGINAAQTSYKSPTTVLNLSTICKHASAVWKSTCIKDEKPDAKQKVEDFLILFNVAFPAELGKTAVENQVQFQRQKVVDLPSTEDIMKLVRFLRVNRRLWFSKIRSGDVINISYGLRQLASFTLVSIMVFNRRRPGELERITINDFRTLKSAYSASAAAGHFTNDEDRLMAERYKRFEIRGKLNRTVPVLVDFEIEECLNLIIARRNDAGIPPDNPYVFACRSTDLRNRYLRAYFLLRSYAKQCGAAKPHLLKATELRKQIATQCALQDLSENVIHDVANFMGHHINIHNSIYRMPVDKRDIVRMSKILESIQGGTEDGDGEPVNDESEIVGRIQGGTEDGDLNNELVIDESEEVDEKAQSLNHENIYAEHGNLNSHDQNVDNDDDDDVSYQPPEHLNLMDTDSSSSDDQREHRKKKGRHVQGLKRVCSSKKPWSTEEQRAALEHFGKFVENSKLPSISLLCEQLPLINELKDRSPTSVKSWIQNQIVNMRASSSNDHSSSNNKVRWTSSMKGRLNTVFAHHFEDGTLPSKPECNIAIEKYAEFASLTAAALKTAVANERQRRSKHTTSNNKVRWTSSMKGRLNTVFAHHFEDGTLPSKPECNIAIEKYAEFASLTAAALKTAVANERQRRSKHTKSIQGGTEDGDLNNELVIDESEEVDGKAQSLNHENIYAEHGNLNSHDQNVDNDDDDDVSYQPPEHLNLMDTDSSSSDDQREHRKKKGRHVQGLKRVCSSKKPWSTEEQRAALEHFGKFVENSKLPSISLLCEQLPLINELKDRSPTSVKSWIQ